MELNITHLMERSDDMYLYSASAAELGEDAGRITWRNAMDSAEIPPPLLTDDQLPEFRDYIREFGAWSDEAIDSWDAQNCNALCLQMIAGDIRERQAFADDDDLERYEENFGGRIFEADDGQWYYYVGD
jgi:hypothetical protein